MRPAVTAAVTLLLLCVALPPAHAASFSRDDVTVDANALAELETRAEHAAAREQCFLYTELVRGYTDVAGRQLAAGDIEHASTTLQRVQHFAELIHLRLARDSKQLRNAEMLMHSAAYRLAQYTHVVSTEDKPVVETTLKQLDKVHAEMLAQVFAH
jgi:hypothetical protein